MYQYDPFRELSWHEPQVYTRPGVLVLLKLSVWYLTKEKDDLPFDGSPNHGFKKLPDIAGREGHKAFLDFESELSKDDAEKLHTEVRADCPHICILDPDLILRIHKAACAHNVAIKIKVLGPNLAFLLEMAHSLLDAHTVASRFDDTMESLFIMVEHILCHGPRELIIAPNAEHRRAFEIWKLWNSWSRHEKWDKRMDRVVETLSQKNVLGVMLTEIVDCRDPEDLKVLARSVFAMHAAQKTKDPSRDLVQREQDLVEILRLLEGL